MFGNYGKKNIWVVTFPILLQHNFPSTFFSPCFFKVHRSHCSHAWKNTRCQRGMVILRMEPPWVCNPTCFFNHIPALSTIELYIYTYCSSFHSTRSESLWRLLARHVPKSHFGGTCGKKGWGDTPKMAQQSSLHQKENLVASDWSNAIRCRWQHVPNNLLP
jgi:hypothetical protein